MSVADVDKIMTDGMGMRYAFIGPFETCHLNAEGMLCSLWLRLCKLEGEYIFIQLLECARLFRNG